MKMKKMTALLISTVMVLGLAGCGNQNTQNSQSRQNSALTVQAAGGSAETQSTSVSEQPGTVENTTEALPNALTEVSTETLIDSMTGVTDPVKAEVSTETLTEETSELSSAGNDVSVADSESESGKTLVVYYSATGTTENVANYIAAATDADLFELEPVNPYSSDDLNWTDDNSRVVYEHDNPNARVVELASATVDNWDSYDTIFIGYPIWWHIAAWPVDGFVTANDFSGKTVIPFCTSSSSDLGESGELLAEAAGTGNWLAGERFSSGASAESVQAWVESLGLN